MPRRPRVAIVHQGFIPHYRVSFFEHLHRDGGCEYVVFHGAPPHRSGHRELDGPFAFPEVRVRNREVGVGGRTVLWQPVVRRVIQGGFAGAVIGLEAKLGANMVLAPILRALGRPVLAWGQGYDKHEDADAGPGAHVARALKRGVGRTVDGHLVYTAGGAARLVARGCDPRRITVVRNTLDVEAEIERHRRLLAVEEATLRRRHGLGAATPILLFLGRVYPEKRLVELIRLARRLAEEPAPMPVELIVLGDGPALPAARREAAGTPGVRFLGEVLDPDTVASWLRVATAVVVPGKVGLVVNHAFAHGVPVITRESALHAPEREYIRSGENGLVIAGDEAAFAARVREFLCCASEQARLAAGALRSRESLTLAAMVRAFDDAVARTLGVRGVPVARGELRR